LQDMTE